MLARFFTRTISAAVLFLTVCLGSQVAAAEEPILTITTLAGETVEFDLDQLKALPQHEVVTQTMWSEPGKKFTFKGVMIRDLLAEVGGDKPTTLVTRAVNDYAADLPVADTDDYDVILAYEQNGQLLDTKDKGPLWVVYPYDDHKELNNKIYYSRAIWQLNSIEYQ